MNLPAVELPSNRKFGFFFTALFTLLGGYFYYQSSYIFAFSFFFLMVITIAVTLINADWLRPLNQLWMRFGLLLGFVIRPIVMGIIFFGIFTPVSLGMKLLGRDELHLKLSDKKSHWKIRDGEDKSDDSFRLQF